MTEEKHLSEASDIPSFDAPTKGGHFACEIVLPPDLPATWGKPQAYVISAVNNKFGDNEHYRHVASPPPNNIMFITSDEDLRDTIQTFAGALVKRMAKTTRSFRLRLTGTSLLNDDQVKFLLLKLGGDLINFRFTGPHASADYGHTAFAELRQAHDWVLKDSALPFRWRGHNRAVTIELVDQPTKHSRPPTNSNPTQLPAETTSMAAVVGKTADLATTRRQARPNRPGASSSW